MRHRHQSPIIAPATGKGPACALAALVLAQPSVHAANANWIGGGTDALWSNTSNWSASPVPGTGNTATFNAAAGAGGTVIDLGAGVTVNTITFTGPGFAAYTVGAGGANAQSLTLNGTGNAGFSAGGTATTAQITINAALTINNTQQWVINNGANPWIVNGNVTPNGTAGSTIQVKINGRNVQFNGVLADQAGGAKLQMAGANGATTAILANPNNSFTGGLYFDNGSVSVNSIGMIGSNSAAGAGGDLLFGSGFGGGTLVYTGTGDTTDRVVRINHGFHGATITQSGASGNLKFTSDLTFAASGAAVGSPTITFSGSTAGTGEFAGNLVDNGTAGVTPLKDAVSSTPTNSLKLHSVDGITVGSAVSGTGIAGGTTVTSINASTKVITLSANTTGAIAQGTNITVGGVVNITHITKSGSGTWTISGANTHSGITTISGGNLVVSSLNSVSSPAASSSLGRPTDVYHGTIGIGSSSTAGRLTYTGSDETTDRVISLKGTTGGVTIDQSGTGLLKFTSDISVPGAAGTDQRKTLTLQGSGTGAGEISGAIPNATVGTAGQLATSLTKAGTGTWTLSNTSSYTGNTNITQGKLVITGNISTSALTTVSNGATLGGGGTVGALSFGGGAFFDIFDALGGNPLDTGTISFSSVGFGIDNLVSQGGVIDWSTVANGTYTLITGTLNTTNLGNLNEGNAFDIDGINGSRTAYFQTGSLKLVVIPEPTTALLGGLGLLALLRRRRR
jgi:autotransporter-associated beta strand protein